MSHLPPPPSLPLADPDRLTDAQEKHIPLHDIAVERLALAELDQDLLHKVSITTIGELDQRSRIREIAKLLGGDTITDTTMQGARELLNINE